MGVNNLLGSPRHMWMDVSHRRVPPPGKFGGRNNDPVVLIDPVRDEVLGPFRDQHVRVVA